MTAIEIDANEIEHSKEPLKNGRIVKTARNVIKSYGFVIQDSKSCQKRDRKF